MSSGSGEVVLADPGYARSSPVKLIKVWAEKEFRNLKRIRESGMKCPVPLIIKDNLIVMEFLGAKGVAYPSRRG